MRLTFVFSCVLITLEMLHSTHAAERIFTIGNKSPIDSDPKKPFGDILLDGSKKFEEFTLETPMKYFANKGRKKEAQNKIFVSLYVLNSLKYIIYIFKKYLIYSGQATHLVINELL